MPYKRKKKKGTEWVAEVMRQGQRHYKVFKTKNEALRWEAEIRSAPVESLKTPTACLTLIEWATQYLDYAQSRYVKKTFQEKRAVFKRFLGSIKPELPVERLALGMVLKHLQREAKARSGYAANKDRKNLVAGWNWGIKYLGLPKDNPCLVDKFPEVRKPRYIPPEEDFWKILEAAEGQDRIMLLTYLHLAARRNELFRLMWSDVDFENQRIRLSTRKRAGGTLEYDWLPMTQELEAQLRAHKENATTEVVFPDPETGLPYKYRLHYMRNLCRRAGVKAFGFHAIRHLTASLLAQMDIPMVTIMVILRHKNLATTERYIRSTKSVRSALEFLSQRKSRPRVPTTGNGKTQKENRAA